MSQMILADMICTTNGQIVPKNTTKQLTANNMLFRINALSRLTTENTPFAIDVQINDDDDGDQRDSKWAWFAPSGQDWTWTDPSQLGPAILQPAF